MVKYKIKTVFAAHKKGFIIALCLVLAVAAGLGIWYYAANNSSDPVYVYPFHFIGMTEYWGDSQESYGPVSSDNIQTVFLSGTQTVTEVLVETGDAVKKGDLLMTFDTTLDSLKLERKRLDVEKKKLELEEANNRLAEIRSMVPMVVIEYETDMEFDENLGDYIDSAGYEIYNGPDKLQYDGSSELTPLVLWLSKEKFYHSGMDEELRAAATELQWLNYLNSLEDQETEGDSQTPEGPSPASDVYVAIRVTENDQEYAAKKTWTGLYVTKNGMQFFDPLVSDPFMQEQEDSYVGSDVIIGSGYTAAQIAQMRSDQEKKIKDLEFQVKMVETEYKLMEKEFSDGNIYAEVDGQVISVLTEEEARNSRQPMLKVSGGGGFYIQGFVNELEKDKMTIGMPVTVNDWNTGSVYEAEVAAIGDFPSQDGYYSGMGNPNSSYYPFTVFVDGSADLQTGSYVSVMYSTTEGGNGVYLENPFIRTENGSSYVLVQGENGTLEKRYVTTGKSLWGNYTEIRAGITEEDLIAFPYGKQVKPGAKAVEGDMGDLYG